MAEMQDYRRNYSKGRGYEERGYPPVGYGPPPLEYAPPTLGYAPPPLGYAPPPPGYGVPPQQLGYAPPGGVVMAQPRRSYERDWSTGLFDCCSDCSTCCSVYCCGSAMFDVFLSGRFDENVCGTALTWDWGLFMPTMLLRLRLRTNQKIQGSLFTDFMTSLCCLPCAQCQLQRELKMIEKNNPGQLPEYKKFIP